MNHLKLIIGLTPITCVTIFVLQWFILGTMEHGWEGFKCKPFLCPNAGLHLVQAALEVVAVLMFLFSCVKGIQEACVAWRRIRRS